MFEDCIEFNDRRRVFTASEEGKTYTLNNLRNLEIAKVKVDGCMFNENVKKCDWLFLIAEDKVIFVELKGSDIRQGVKQLEETYNRLRNSIEVNEMWFRLSIGEKNSVPKSIRDNKVYKNLFAIAKGNLKIGKRLTDTIK